MYLRQETVILKEVLLGQQKDHLGQPKELRPSVELEQVLLVMEVQVMSVASLSTEMTKVEDLRHEELILLLLRDYLK